MPYRSLAILVVVLLLAFLLAAQERAHENEKDALPTHKDEDAEIKAGDKTLTVLLADDQAERTRGLSGKETLAPYDGMVFVFDESARHGIWMKDMNFAIDIIWIDEDFRVVDIKKNAEPESFPEVFKPRERARYVLEMPAGFAEKHNLAIGAHLEFEQELNL